jgi:hypothetical protein
MVHQGRRYGPSGQAVRSIRAGSTVHQGRRYGPSGQAVRSIRAGGTVRQGRRICSIHHSTNHTCRTTLLQLSWAGSCVEMTLYGLGTQPRSCQIVNASPPPTPLLHLGRVGRRGRSIIYGLRPLWTSPEAEAGVGCSVGVVLT